MMKSIKKGTAAIGLLAISAYQSVWAALPTPVAPSTAPAAGDWISLIKGYIKDGGFVLGLRDRSEAERPLNLMVMFAYLPINGIIKFLHACGTLINSWNWLSR